MLGGPVEADGGRNIGRKSGVAITLLCFSKHQQVSKFTRDTVREGTAMTNIRDLRASDRRTQWQREGLL